MSEEYEQGEKVEIEIRHHSGKNPNVWLDAEFIERKGHRIWVMVKTKIGLRRISTSIEKVRKKQSCAS